MATQYARRPKGTPIEIRNDATNNQAAALDRCQREIERSREAEEEERNRPVKIIRLQFGVGSAWSDVRVDISSLRRALGLPNYPLFREGEDPANAASRTSRRGRCQQRRTCQSAELEKKNIKNNRSE